MIFAKRFLNNTWSIDLCAIALILGFFGFFMLGSYPLQVPDEARYSEIPRGMVVNHEYLTPRLNGVKYFEKPIFFYWLQASAIKVFGLNEWALRLWTAVLALIGSVMTYVTGRLLYGRLTGLLACGVLASSGLYFVMGHTITLDMALTIFISACLFAFILGINAPADSRLRRYLMWTSYAMAGIAVLTKGIIGILLPSLVILSWLLITKRKNELLRINLISGCLIFLAIVLPWHILVQLKNPEFFQFYVIEQHFMRYLTNISRREQPIYFFVGVLLIGFLPWSPFLINMFIKRKIKIWGKTKENHTNLFFLLWFSIIFVFFSISKSKLVPYLLPVFPAISILVGNYLSSIWRHQNKDRLSFYLFSSIFFLVAIGAIIAPLIVDLVDLGLSAYTLQYMKIMAGVFIGFVVIITALTYYNKSIRIRLGLILIFALAIQLQFLTVWPKIDTTSLKPMTSYLEPLLQPDTEVMSYQYFQDVPVYLQRQITVVNPNGEVRWGSQIEDTQDWMIDIPVFEQRWESGDIKYLFIREGHLNELFGGTGLQYHVLYQLGNKLLLTNTPDTQMSG